MVAFVTSFTGARLPSHASRDATTPRTTLRSTPRATMGSQVAPKIVLRDTGKESENSVTVTFAPIAADEGAAAGVAASAALAATLRRRVPALPTTTPPPKPPAGADPVAFYFPSGTRNSAPHISLSVEAGLSVRYSAVDAVVAGASANSVSSVAFWKKPSYKWADMAAKDVPVATPTQEPEILSTAKYEKYFPTKTRNLAPVITMRAPKGDWDKTGFVSVASERIPFREALARAVTLPSAAEVAAAGSAASATYFSGDFKDCAPEIVIGDDRVEWSFVEVPTDLQAASRFARSLSS